MIHQCTEGGFLKKIATEKEVDVCVSNKLDAEVRVSIQVGISKLSDVM